MIGHVLEIRILATQNGQFFSVCCASQNTVVNLLSLAHQNPSATMDVHVNSIALAAARLEDTIRNLSSGFSRRQRSVDTFRENNGFWQWRLAFPSHLSVLCCANLFLHVSSIAKKNYGGLKVSISTYLIPSWSICPYFDQSVVKLQRLLIDGAAIKLGRIYGHV